ncbi:MAG: CoA pyrophosphatase [Minwuiales bacterium]|nr:CoA pyrophosphatase [Minwuiales bacterium]
MTDVGLADEIARRLRAVTPDDVPKRSDFDLNPQNRPAVPRPLRDAAVLVPLVDRAGGMTVLLTRRTEHLNSHAGQISFPGGRLEDHDSGPEDAALRETEEETGIAAHHVSLIGRLDVYETVTGFAVTPVVGIVRPGFELAPDEFEVAEIFEVPLAFLMDPANHQRHGGWHNGTKRYWYAMPYGDYYIWGATAGMLVNLHHRLGDLC